LHKQYHGIDKTIDLLNWRPSEFVDFTGMIWGVTEVARQTLVDKARKKFNLISKERKLIKSSPVGKWMLKHCHCTLLKSSYTFDSFLNLRRRIKGRYKITNVICTS